MTSQPPTWTPLRPDQPPELPEGRGHVVAVVSLPGAREAEDGPEVAVELARAWARAGRRVVLADLGLSHPSLHTPLGQELGEGVTDAVAFGSSVGRVARRVEGESFFFISAGTAVAEPAEVLDRPRWAALCQGFQEAGATLVAFVPADSETLEPVLREATEAVLLGTSDDDPAAVEGLPEGGALALLELEGTGSAQEDDEESVASLADLAPEDAEDEEPLASLGDLAPEEDEEEPVASLEDLAPEEDEPAEPVDSLDDLAPEEDAAEPVASLDDLAPEEKEDDEPLASLDDLAPEEDEEEPVASLDDLAPEDDEDEEPVASLDDLAPEEDELPAVAGQEEDAFDLGDEGESFDAGAGEDGLDLEDEEDTFGPGLGEDAFDLAGEEDTSGAAVGSFDLEDEEGLAPDAEEEVLDLDEEAESLGMGPGDDAFDLDDDPGLEPQDERTGAGEPIPAGDDAPPVEPSGDPLLEDAPAGPEEVEGEPRDTHPPVPLADEILAEAGDAPEPAVQMGEDPVASASGRAPSRPGGRRTVLLVVLLLVVAGAAAAWWLGYVEIPGLTPPGASGTSQVVPDATPAESVPPLAAAEPVVETSPAAAWAVAVEAHQTRETAWERAGVLSADAPEHLWFTVPVEVEGTVFHRVLVGAVPGATDAQALLEAVAAELDTDGADWLIRETPLAFSLGEEGSLPDARTRALELRDAAIPAYVLAVSYSDGSQGYRVYAGAFADASEAAALRAFLQESGLDDFELTDRTGLLPE